MATKQSKKTSNTKEYYQAVGRRREAIATARLYSIGKDKEISINGAKHKVGDIVVNGKSFKDAFVSPVYLKICSKPFMVTDTRERFVTTVRVTGGGVTGQVEAIVHAIARALTLIDKEQFGQTLRAEGLLTRDARTRERRMVGTGGKSRRKKQSPKR